MTVGIIGLGLIGGSMAKAFKTHTDFTIYGYDINESSVKAAIKQNVIDGFLTDALLCNCELVIVALYPDAVIEYIKRNKNGFKDGAIVIDCCGVKEHVCTPLFALAENSNFCFYGGHPMAGTQFSGFENSRGNMFDGASMVIVPPPCADTKVTEFLKQIFTDIGFGCVTLSDAKTHDKIIAYTSQLAHVVSSAYVKSPNALIHGGFSAGSFKDLTRVAALNEDMWTELFLENAKYLSWEIDRIADELKKYSHAIKNGDADTLHKLLEEGTMLKKKSLQEEFREE